MKRILVLLLGFTILAGSSVPAFAGSGKKRANRQAAYSRYYDDQVNSRYNRYDEYEDDRSIWEKHRDKITTAAGAGGGAILGGMVGGKKGAIIGGIAGAAGAALYTYKIRKKNN
jgi:outer membrane lipoprotein SlyB